MSPSPPCETLPSPAPLRARASSSRPAPRASGSPAASVNPSSSASANPSLSAVFNGRVQPYRARIRGYLRRHVDEESAEDLTQDVMLAAWRSLPRLHDLQALERWLFCVAAHHVASFHRRRSRQAQTTVCAVSSAPERASSAQPASGLSLAALTGAQMLQHAPTFPGESAASNDPPACSGRTEADSADAVGLAAFASCRSAETERVETRLWVEELLKQAQAVCSQAQCAVLRGYYAGASFEEIGAHMQVDSATVRSHFRRARACLLSHLFEHAPDLAGGPQGIADVVRRLNSEASKSEEASKVAGLNQRDNEALYDPRRHVKAHRAACLKIAPHLPLPF